MWDETKLETHIVKNLKSVMAESAAMSACADYISARGQVLKLIEEIKAAEPELSDHGPRHIHDVLENAWFLIEGQDICEVSCYILCLSILYHDVGNYYERVNHNKKIAEIFNETFPKVDSRNALRSLVTKIAGAHTGKSLGGNDDTLKDLEIQNTNIFKTQIDAQELGAILRFADEMAEGPHRTSYYRLKKDGYEEESKKYHAYARCCQSSVSDRKAGRILLNYIIPIEHKNGNVYHIESGYLLSEFLGFVYDRILKFDQERKYCRHYSKSLADFKETSIVIEFVLNDEETIPTKLQPLVLNDLIIPGNTTKELHEYDKDYKIESIIEQLSGVGGHE